MKAQSNETVEKPLVRKMFIKISHNRLKNCQNAVRNTKNQTLFSVSVPLFKNHFLKRDFFDSFNGLQSGTFLDMLRLFSERARISGNVA